MVSVILIGILVALGILIAFIVVTYNGLVTQKALVDEGWSGIDVQLKRRYDLIPNLVATVKGYSIHEKEVLEKVVQARSQAMQAQSMGQHAAAENALSGALKTLFAVAENYPNLKANENFLQLQQQLAHIENELQLSRRYYNGAARNYNIAVTRFPSNIVARLSNFEKVSYFEIEGAERRNVTVDFSNK